MKQESERMNHVCCSGCGREHVVCGGGWSHRCFQRRENEGARSPPMSNARRLCFLFLSKISVSRPTPACAREVD
eukprot:scaffold27928_cov115-Isochrysis_galbana.AAC.8